MPANHPDLRGGLEMHALRVDECNRALSDSSPVLDEDGRFSMKTLITEHWAVTCRRYGNC